MKQPASRSQLYALAVGLLVVTCTLAWYAVHRQQLADHRQQVADSRAETQRQAICAILANIPGQIPPEIANARGVFARPHHPQDCDPIRHPKPPPTPAPTPGQAPGPTVQIIPDGGGASSASTVAPRPSPTPTHRPKPRPTSSPSPRPTPSPSPTCSLQHPLRCLP